MTGVHWCGVVSGCLGMLAAGLFDWASLRGVPVLKQALALLAVLLHALALWAAVAWSEAFELPSALRWLGGAVLLPSLGLLVYSFFLEIPFARTYARHGASGELVTTGTYALVRHPGVLWYGAFLLGLLALTGSWTLVVAAPLWILLDVVYVYLQERLFFHEMFPGYDDYWKTTPMILPTGRSLRRCLTTLHHQEPS